MHVMVCSLYYDCFSKLQHTAINCIATLELYYVARFVTTQKATQNGSMLNVTVLLLDDRSTTNIKQSLHTNNMLHRTKTMHAMLKSGAQRDSRTYLIRDEKKTRTDVLCLRGPERWKRRPHRSRCESEGKTQRGLLDSRAACS